MAAAVDGTARLGMRGHGWNSGTRGELSDDPAPLPAPFQRRTSECRPRPCLPTPAFMPVGAVVAGVLGTMYVLEGSRLGAQVLLKSVMRSSDAVATAATAYLSHG